jgi:hypothetical protein
MQLSLVSPTQPTAHPAPSFEDFWLLYPRKVARKAARTAFERLTSADQQAAIVAIADWRRVFATRDPEFIPHAATWLNGERWADELPREYKPQAVQYHTAEPAQSRAPMPDSVRKLIEQLRAAK